MQIKKSSFVAEQTETSKDDGYRRLWLNVFLAMLSDLQNGLNLAAGRLYNTETNYKKMVYHDARIAAAWFDASLKDLTLVCEYANLDLRYVKRKVKPMLEKFALYEKARSRMRNTAKTAFTKAA